MQTIRTSKVALYITILILWSTPIFADDNPGGIGGDPGLAGAPLDNWLLIALAITAVILFYLVSKKRAEM